MSMYGYRACVHTVIHILIVTRQRNKREDNNCLPKLSICLVNKYYHIVINKYPLKIYPALTAKHITLDEKQITLDDWLIERFRYKLSKASIIASKISRPIILYRNTIEEAGYAAEEEVATVNERYIVVQVFTYGGFIPPSFQQQYVFTLDEFPVWIMKRSRDLLLQCIDNVDQVIC